MKEFISQKNMYSIKAISESVEKITYEMDNTVWKTNIHDKNFNKELIPQICKKSIHPKAQRYNII